MNGRRLGNNVRRKRHRNAVFYFLHPVQKRFQNTLKVKLIKVIRHMMIVGHMTIVGHNL